MADLITLDCQKCGATLEIRATTELFQCKWCKTPYIVRREEGKVSIRQLIDRVSGLESYQANTIPINREIESINEEIKQEEKSGDTGCLVSVLAFFAVLLIVGLSGVRLSDSFLNRLFIFLGVPYAIGAFVSWVIKVNREARLEELRTKRRKLEDELLRFKQA